MDRNGRLCDMADKMMRVGGKDNKDIARPIKVDSDGTMSTKNNALIAEHTSTLSDLFVGDTTSGQGAAVVPADLSSFNQKVVKIENSTNATVVVALYYTLSTSQGATRYLIKGGITVQPSTTIILDNFYSDVTIANALSKPIVGLVLYVTKTGTGNFNVKFIGGNSQSGAKSQLLAKDQATGKQVELSAMQDGDGNYVTRVVDAAPFAYDKTDGSLGRLRVRQKMSQVIKNYKNAPTPYTCFLGENLVPTSAQCIPLDVSDFTKKAIMFENNTNASISIALYWTLESILGAKRIVIQEGITIAAGATRHMKYSPEDWQAILNEPLIGLIAYVHAPGAGSFNMAFIGGVY